MESTNIGDFCKFARHKINIQRKQIGCIKASTTGVFKNWIVLGLAKEDKEPVESQGPSYEHVSLFPGGYAGSTHIETKISFVFWECFITCPLKWQWLELFLGFHSSSALFHLIISVLYSFYLILAFQAGFLI